MASVKKPLEDDDEAEKVRPSKAKRHDLEPPPTDDVDIKLAERLDNILKISETRKPKFFMNKPKTNPNIRSDHLTTDKNNDQSKLKPRNLTKTELRERLLKRYETLVPELDPHRPQVNVVKVLSAGESLMMAKDQAKKQLDRQLELNSVAKNQQAHQFGLSSFRFNDGYEMPNERAPPTNRRAVLKKPTSSSNYNESRSRPNHTNEGKKSPLKGLKSVKFAIGDGDTSKRVVTNQSKNNHNDGGSNDDDDDDDGSTDDLTESDYTTSDEDNCDDAHRVKE